MKRIAFKSGLVSVCLLLLTTLSYAGSPLWTFTPLTATTVSVPANGTATVQYQVTNQSSRAHTLVMNAIQGVTQITSGPGICGNPFTLAGRNSCVLSLQIDGSHVASGNTNGPVVCDHSNSLQCYRPSAANTLKISKTASQYTLGGMISGLTGTVYLKQNSSSDAEAFGADSHFTFTTPLTNGASYEVTVATQPENETCSVSHGVGTINGANVSDVYVTCSPNAYTVGGTVSNLSGTVVLLNNGEDNNTISTNGPFTFSEPVADGAPYDVTVGTQPSGQTCVVSNGSGTMSAPVSNVDVSCSTNATTLSTSVSSLALSKTGYTEYGVSGTPSSGTARIITITNTGGETANNLAINYPTWPSGTTANSTCDSTLAPSSSCTITVTPGNTATSNGTSPCDNGTAPVAQTITVSADNVSSPVTTDVTVLGYGCIYQGGYVYALDDSTSTSSSVGGKVAATSNQSSGIIWSSNSSGTYDGGVAIYGISETSTTSSPNPSSGQVAGQTACKGNTDGACNTNNIYVYYQTSATGHPINTSYYAVGLCKQTISGYSDWYLPAACEMGYDQLGSTTGCGNSTTPTLQNMVSNLVVYNGLNLFTGNYWSSTEYMPVPNIGAWRENFSGSSSVPIATSKGGSYQVRCTRAF